MEETIKTAEAVTYSSTESDIRLTLELLLANQKPMIWEDLACALAVMEVLPHYDHEAVLRAILKRKDPDSPSILPY